MHRQAIRERLAEILDLEIERIGLQAKTGEGDRHHRPRRSHRRRVRGAVGTEEGRVRLQNLHIAHNPASRNLN